MTREKIKNILMPYIGYTPSFFAGSDGVSGLDTFWDMLLSRYEKSGMDSPVGFLLTKFKHMNTVSISCTEPVFWVKKEVNGWYDSSVSLPEYGNPCEMVFSAEDEPVEFSTVFRNGETVVRILYGTCAMHLNKKHKFYWRTKK